MKRDQLTGVILAGGKARRLGGVDKGLQPYHGRPLVQHALEILAPLCREVFINANRNLAVYRRFGHPVIPDPLPDFQGPLAGILAALQRAHTPGLLVVPCDSPHLRRDLLERLAAALADHDITIAHDGRRLHPVVMALRTELAGDLSAWLATGERKIDRWARRHRWTAVDGSDAPDQFRNLNTPEDFDGDDRTQ